MEAVEPTLFEPAPFEAVLHPHRSLSPRGLQRLAAAVALVLAGTTGLFWWLGAWPVAGFNGLDIVLVVLLLVVSRRQARSAEIVRLDATRLTVERRDARGRALSRRSLDAAWLRVRLEERAGRVPGLHLETRRDGIEIGRALAEAPKRDLAAALAEALHRRRHPLFENPQLDQPG